MSLFHDKKEVEEATIAWIKSNKELYEYVSDFEHKLISDNKK